MTPLEYLRCVGMEFGGEFATDSSTGVQKMLEWCADNLDSLIRVKQLGYCTFTLIAHYEKVPT